MVRASELATRPSIGWVGVGKMGRPMVSRLLAEGWRLTAHSRSLGREDDLVRRGARFGPGVKDAAEADVLCCSLPDDDAVERVVGELLPLVRADQAVLDFGTTSPDLTRRLAEDLASRGARLVDAPVSGGPAGARDGGLSIMVGASEGESEDLHSLLAALGRPTWFGGVGRGQIAKLCNQIVVGCGIAALTEALRLAEAYDEPLDLVLQAFRNGAADSWVVRSKGDGMVRGDWEPQGSARTHLKDLDLATAAASGVDVPLALTSVVHMWFASLVAAGHGERDHSALSLVAAPEVTAVPPE